VEAPQQYELKPKDKSRHDVGAHRPFNYYMVSYLYYIVHMVPKHILSTSRGNLIFDPIEST